MRCGSGPAGCGPDRQLLAGGRRALPRRARPAWHPESHNNGERPARNPGPAPQRIGGIRPCPHYPPLLRRTIPKGSDTLREPRSPPAASGPGSKRCGPPPRCRRYGGGFVGLTLRLHRGAARVRRRADRHAADPRSSPSAAPSQVSETTTRGGQLTHGTSAANSDAAHLGALTNPPHPLLCQGASDRSIEHWNSNVLLPSFKVRPPPLPDHRHPRRRAVADRRIPDRGSSAGDGRVGARLTTLSRWLP